MLSSINPFGERSRNSRWWLTVTTYLVGSIAGGATTGITFGALGEFLPMDDNLGLLILLIAAILGLAADIGIGRLIVPSLQRQVNEDWLTTYRGWVYGISYGYQLGLGIVTIVATSTVWLVWVVALGSGSWFVGFALGAIFGIGRGVLILSAARAHEPAQLRQLFIGIAKIEPQIHRTSLLSTGLVAVTAAGGLVI